MKGVRCDQCPKKFKNQRGLAVHTSHVHKKKVKLDEEEPKPKETPPEIAARLRSEGQELIEQADVIESAWDDLQAALEDQ